MSYRRGPADEAIPHLALVFGLGGFANAHQEFTFIRPNLPLQAERIAQIRMIPLVKGACQSDAWLHGEHRALPPQLVVRH
jgi:hypothetical protein